MAGRPKLFDEREVIAKAAEVFWEKGYEAASADELLKAMNIGKGSFYLAFMGGKRELFEKTLDQFSGDALKKLTVELKNSKDQIAHIKNMFLGLADAPAKRKQRGCYLGNAVVEMANLDKGLFQKANKLLGKLEQTFKEVIEQAQKEKKILTKEKPVVLAKYLINLWNGINITRRTNTEPELLESVIRLHLKTLE